MNNDNIPSSTTKCQKLDDSPTDTVVDSPTDTVVDSSVESEIKSLLERENQLLSDELKIQAERKTIQEKLKNLGYEQKKDSTMIELATYELNRNYKHLRCGNVDVNRNSCGNHGCTLPKSNTCTCLCTCRGCVLGKKLSPTHLHKNDEIFTRNQLFNKSCLIYTSCGRSVSVTDFGLYAHCPHCNEITFQLHRMIINDRAGYYSGYTITTACVQCMLLHGAMFSKGVLWEIYDTE